MMMMASASDLIVVFLALELLSILFTSLPVLPDPDLIRKSRRLNTFCSARLLRAFLCMVLR